VEKVIDPRVTRPRHLAPQKGVDTMRNRWIVAIYLLLGSRAALAQVQPSRRTGPQ